MNGMRTSTTDFETANLRTLAAAEAPTALGRLQNSIFDKTAAAEHEIPGTNLSIVGFGMDMNGNAVVRVQTPNQRVRSIQTNGVLPATHRAGEEGMSFFNTAKPEAVAAVEQEVKDYVEQYGSGKLKEHYKKYDKQGAAEYEEPVEDIVEEVAEEENVEPIEDEPVDGDFMLSDSGTLGGQTSVSEVGGRFIGEFNTLEEAEAAIKAKMEKDNWFPSIWYQDDHGGVMPYTLGELVATSKKTAAIFDGYAYRVTIETRAGDTNESYTAVLSMLKSIDVRYREVRRYTIDPDRVCMDILVKAQDVEVLLELAKEVKADGVTITFNDNISEALKSRQIVTPEKELSTDKPQE
jgi:hypothetical protein